MNKSINLHAGHRKRLRQRMLNNNIASMEDYEILEYLLTLGIPRKDTNDLAHLLIKEFGSLNDVFLSTPEELMKVNGIGEACAVFLCLFPKLFQKYQMGLMNNSKYIRNSNDAANFFKPLLQFSMHEEVHVLTLDNNSKIIKNIKINEGSVSQVTTDIRKLIEPIFKNNASGVIFAHNHPNGKALPSAEDDIFTKKAIQIISSVGIQVLDHIIIATDGNYYSYKSSRKLEEFANDIKWSLSLNSPPLNYDF